MKKKTIQAFFILTLSTGLSKIFNILNRILISRYLKEQGMGLYMMLMPTLSLVITLSQMGIPSAIFKLIADPHYSNKKVMKAGSIITAITTLLMMILFSLSIPSISTYLLKNNDTLIPLKALVVFVPLTSVSSILKNYFMGTEQHITIAKSQFSEEITRLILTFGFLSYFTHYSMPQLVTLTLIAMSIGELVSIIHLLFHMPSYRYTHSTLNIEPTITKEFFKISLPLTGSRIMHSITNFLEPILINRLMLKNGFLPAVIQSQYGMMSGYILSMITMPTFLTTVIYRLLLPIFLKNIDHRSQLLKHFYLGLSVCFCISIPFTFIFFNFPGQCLMLLYKTTNGASYLKYLSIPFTIYYLQTPLSALMQALNMNKVMFVISLIECSLEIVLYFILIPYFNILAIALTFLIGITITFVLSSIALFFVLFNHK